MYDAARTRPPRARAVADAPVERLIAHADELARRWAIALIMARAPDAIGEVPLADLAREAPALCARVLRALQADVELERLTGRGASSGREACATARRLPSICGAGEPVAVIDAVEALRGVLWEALLGELSEPSARLHGDACDRLAHVCAAIAAAAVDAIAPSAADSSDERAAREHRAPSASGASPSGSRSSGAVIVDEQEPQRARTQVEPVPRGPGAAAGEIEIRDQRREEGAAAWISSIGAQLERFERDGQPFAVLLVELLNIERLRREEPPDELAQLAAGVEEALASALEEWSGTLTRERPGRFWLLAPATDRTAAARLEERLRGAVGTRASHGAAPLAVAIGTAVCPDDGRLVAALAAHADVGLFAARSAVNAPASRSASVVDESA